MTKNMKWTEVAFLEILIAMDYFGDSWQYIRKPLYLQLKPYKDCMQIVNTKASLHVAN